MGLCYKNLEKQQSKVFRAPQQTTKKTNLWKILRKYKHQAKNKSELHYLV
jgi:hypothetical protein